MDELCRPLVERHSDARGHLGPQSPDLIDELLDFHESDPSVHSEADLQDFVLVPFSATPETVAGTCSFMLCALLRNHGNTNTAHPGDALGGRLQSDRNPGQVFQESPSSA